MGDIEVGRVGDEGCVTEVGSLRKIVWVVMKHVWDINDVAEEDSACGNGGY